LKQVLVDSSVWIDFFRTGEFSSHLDSLIDEDLIIAHNALQNECAVYSLDKHFQQLHRIISIDLFPY